MNLTLQLNDGRTALNRWQTDLASLPVIGEILDIRLSGGTAPDGYHHEAQVARIDHHLRNGNITVILEAAPATTGTARNVIFLNANYIPANRREEIEAFLRRKIDMPIFEWVQSHEPMPITGFHGPRSLGRPVLGQLQAKIRNLLAPPSLLPR